MWIANGSSVTAKSATVYRPIWRRVYSGPCVTGSMGSPARAYSFERYSASDQKWGGVQAKMMRKSSSASGATSFATAAQPSTGGIAPEAPPITMFCGVAGFRSTV